MRGGDRIGLAHHVLDHQLVDSRGERCGKVDDVSLHAQHGGGEAVLEVRGVLAGPGALGARMRRAWLRWLVGLAGDREVEVPWQHVTEIIDHVTLALPASNLGLARGEECAAEVLERALGPDAHPVKLGATSVEDAPLAPEGMVRLSSLMGRPAVDTDGREVGVVHELVAEKSGRMLGEAAGNAWVVVGVCTGRSALLARLGLGRGESHVRTVGRWPNGEGDPVVLEN